MAQHKKKRKAFYVVRNLLIVLCSAAIVLFSAEALLKVDFYEMSGASEEQVRRQEEENDDIELLQIEQMDKIDFLSAVDPSSDICEAICETLTPEERERADREKRSRYPLISHMQQADVYDEDTVDIVVLGDSFTWGQSCLNRNEVYWRQAERSLRAQGYNVRIRGVAMISANSYDELGWIADSDLVKELQPDLIVFGYLYNDPDDTANPIEAWNEKHVEIEPKYERILDAAARFFPNIVFRLKNYIIAKTLYTADGISVGGGDMTPIIYAPILKERRLKKFEKQFIAPLSEFSEQSGIPVALMTLAVYRGELLQKELYKPLHELCKKYRNVRSYDSTNAFFHGFDASKHRQNYLINIADLHPGPAMSYFYAQYLEGILKKDFADLLGAPADSPAASPGLAVNEAMPRQALVSTDVKTETELVCTLDYPALTERSHIGEIEVRHYLTLPLEKDFISLSLAEPTDLSRIEVTGDGADDIELYYMRIDEELNYDDHTVLPFGEKNGSVWTDGTADRVTTLFLHAKCANDGGARLTLRIEAD